MTLKYELPTRNGNTTTHIARILKTQETSFKAPEAVRIIGNDADGYRVDIAGRVAWESVSEETFETVRAAKACARAYLAELYRRITLYSSTEDKAYADRK